MSLKAFCTAVAVCVLLPASVRAEQTAVDFAATVRLDTAGHAPVDSVITGHYVFDRDPASFTSQAIDPRFLDAAAGTDYVYTHLASENRLQFPSGSPDLSRGSRVVEVYDNWKWSDGTVVDGVAFLQKTNGVTYELALFGPDTSFSGTAFPANGWLSSGWTAGYFTMHDAFHGSAVLSAVVTSLSVSPVPEPATAILMLAGVAGLGLARRRAVSSNALLKGIPCR
ncbi:MULTISPECIES: PEP-CTERM sorting domain-containing protein [unclassified Rhizobacter]|uniref:PEP-CTERM sorting domain-containing protein n=1 Tax=unclassified Rhizobacter TaxID=2640088 RepID=UPI0006F895B2|nr:MULTISPECIES: PEP-CTERM sorting domain-containing protein [unclassified Rhizobacter]KQU74985.1 hypothetical protein ASC88_26600 [Rhizobacter sp. Root29]KQW00940.1 hypothetical protein ASC98_06365 [Rhizobacter sp. Root1238]KRB03790.1 hypothetical protein ASE08_13870 [Rhizobacter sp. Root16D2]